MSPRTAEYPRPNHFILHLSDTHFVARPGPRYRSVDSEARLRRLFDGVEQSGARPEAIVVTGDLADTGDPAAYARLRAVIDPVADRLGAQVIWVMGSHDDRSAFRQGLLGQGPSTRPIDRAYNVNGLRIVAIDTSVPGEHYGQIDDDQLDWLAEELAIPAPHGTILAMHHPPIPCVLDLGVTVELRDQHILAELLAGSDVCSIIAGHLHFSTSATFAGIPVSVASATCHTQDLNVPLGGTRECDGAQSFNLIHVYGTTVMHSVVPVGDFRTVAYVTPRETASILAGDGITIPPATTMPDATRLHPEREFVSV